MNGKVYIGQSVYIENRIKSHFSRYKSDSVESSSLLHKAMRKYGVDNFTWRILKRCSAKDLDYYEIYYVSLYISNNAEYGYNSTIGGQGTKGSGKIPDRVIDEIYDLLKNAVLSQWDIGKRYGISQRMVSMINTGSLYAKENYSYPLRDFSILGGQDAGDVDRLKSRRKGNFCIDCGTKISYGATRCVNCESRSRIVSRGFNNEEILELLKTHSLNYVANYYGINRTPFVKYCRRNNLPSNKEELQLYQQGLFLCASSSDG